MSETFRSDVWRRLLASAKPLRFLMPRLEAETAAANPEIDARLPVRAGR